MPEHWNGPEEEFLYLSSSPSHLLLFDIFYLSQNLIKWSNVNLNSVQYTSATEIVAELLFWTSVHQKPPCFTWIDSMSLLFNLQDSLSNFRFNILRFPKQIAPMKNAWKRPIEFEKIYYYISEEVTEQKIRLLINFKNMHR